MKVLDDSAVRITVDPTLLDKIVSVVDKSAKLGTNDLMFYWDYDETAKVARVLDTAQPNSNLPNIPSPILRDYSWPGFYKPFAHQKDTASFLSIRQRAFCFNEAGTGKTSAAIWAADYLMNLGLVKRVLVICPLSIMKSAWQDDIFKTAMHRSCGIAHGAAHKRAKIISGSYEFVIINYDGVGVSFDEIAAAKFDLIIIDEANAYKSPSTKRWKVLAKLLTPTTWLWMMTGTPASQSPVDAFGLSRLVSPNRVPKFVTAWRDRVMYQQSRFRWLPKLNAKHDVHVALQPAIRYAKKDCTDLPPVIYQTRHVPMTPQAEKYYKHLKTQFIIEIDDSEKVSAVNAAANLNKLLQVSGGAVYTDTRNVLEFDINPRLNALQEVLDETSNKVIIFVPYRHTIDIVHRYLVDNGTSAEVIQGDVSLSERTRLINNFQQLTDPRVLVIQPQAASHGVTLTAADTIVFWSPVMSVETYMQCVARIDRVGQQNKMTVVHLEGSEVERRIYKMLQGKIDNHQQLVDLYKEEMGI
jgi:SNF2 family DNA or RNA helicase